MPRLAQTQQRLFGLLPLAALGSVWAPASVIGCRYASSSATGGDSAAAAAGSTPPSSTPQPPAVGTVFTRSRLYTSEEVSTFCTLTGDSNAIHIDGGGAAAAAGLPGAILPGLLMAALFPAIIGSHFPGALYLSQSLKFKRYALVGGGLLVEVWLMGDGPMCCAVVRAAGKAGDEGSCSRT